MAKLPRVLEIDGEYLQVPPYVNRTTSGWQVRVRGVPSRHFADDYHGGAAGALRAASDEVPDMQRELAQKAK